MKHILRIFSILIILAMLLGPLSPLTTRTVMAGEDLTQGDFGETEALLTPPHIEAWVNQGIVEGHNWDLFTVITLSVNGEVVETKTVGEETAEYVVFYDVHLVPGDEISMTGQVEVDADESITKTLVVNTLEITDVDPETYHISGRAEPGTQVEVWACWEDGCTETRQVTVERNGKWSTDSNDEGSLIYDLFADMQITAGQGDEEGDYTLFSEKLSTNEPDPVEETAEPDPVEETAEPDLVEKTAEFDPADDHNNGSANYGGLGLLASDLKSEILDLKRDKRKDGSGGRATVPLTIDINTDPLPFGPSGPGLHITPLIAGQNMDEYGGEVLIWNSREKLHIQVKPLNDWLINTIQIYVGVDPVPTIKSGNPAQGEFQYKEDLDIPLDNYTLVLDLVDDLGFSWGQPYEDLRIQNIAIHSDLVKLDPDAPIQGSKIKYLEEEGAWALGDGTFDGARWAWWFKYELTHPQRGHFVDSPVGGLSFETPTHIGKTDESGGFDYFPGERVDLYLGSVYLGSPLSGHKISPLDIYENADADDARVINMARLLQSLDSDASPKEGILITEDVVDCLDQAVSDLGLTGVDFADDAQTEAVIDGTIGYCPELVSVSAEDAKAHLDETTNSTMFRKNISRSPDLTSSKSKMNIMGVWFPALKADGTDAVYDESVAGIPYYDENGDLIRVATEAKPIVVVYTDGVEETGYEDIFAAISRDDGNTFKRMNLSRAADRSSFLLANGEEFFGQAKKPVFQVKGNNILVAWSSKFCSGGRPTYAINADDLTTPDVNEGDDYLFDDPYYTPDIWGVGGPQRSVDYTDDYPEVGEVPYSCVWTARGTIVTLGMINSGGFWAQYVVGDIVWFKPERITSGRRDANQIFLGGSDGAGFAIAWQEDPKGLQPGSASGPGPGWGGATTSHKTDIWYSYITMTDFRKIDANFVSSGDPEHEIEVLERPKALVPMSLPVRITDNDAVNSENIMATTTDFTTWTPVTNPDTSGDGSGTHAYAYEIDDLCESFFTYTNYNDEEKSVCITADNLLLDGDTGASRPNLFLQTYTNNNDTPLDTTDDFKSAWAIMAYEETKGAGLGPPDWSGDADSGPHGDEYLPETGKLAIYHSFDFQNPDLVSPGTIINLPEKEVEVVGKDEYGNDIVNIISNITYIKDELGAQLLDWQGQPQINYENARRPRFMIQGIGAIKASINKTSMLVLYKEGPEGSGRASDIMMRRFVADVPGNPYAPGNMTCDLTEVADNGLTVCVDGAMNMSSVTPTVTTDSMGDPDQDDPYGAVKVVEWVQTVDNLDDLSSTNPYDDARAHRGAIRGDTILMGFSYTPNWAAARNGNDNYDFFVRRSFDGGQTWITDPDGSGVEHCYNWTYPSGTQSAGTKVEECNTFAAGAFESMRNLSQLPNNKESVIEPRIVGAPGTIKVNGVLTGIAEDKQNMNVFYVSYGTSTNPKKDPVTGEQEKPHPLDLYYSLTQDRGENYVEVAWDVNPDSSGDLAGTTVFRWDFLAKGDPEQGEAQLRMTPDGSRFYSTWLQEGEEGSDIWFRRIMSPVFEANVLPEE